MQELVPESTRETKKKNIILSKKIKKYLMIAISIILILIIVLIGFRAFYTNDVKSTKLGFKDIGELATQASYSTAINVTDKSKDFYGVTLPFTQSKYIYSYDVIIKAGLDFSEIDWEKKEKRVIVTLPKIKVLSSEINTNSFKIYHEDESIFSPIKLSELNQAEKELKVQAEKDALANGLLDNARTNAETIIKGLLAKEYDLNEYEIIFVDK